ncbi:addiction module protein [Bremerella alba]|uniref:addiction module protein n=1 Tax=Bremerella alba TaxID=980252 RepID=UPI0036F28BA9
MISISQLTKEALSLPPEERARLAQTLLESIQASSKRLLGSNRRLLRKSEARAWLIVSR